MDAKYNLLIQKYYNELPDKNIYEVRDFFLIKGYLYQEPPSFDNIRKYMNKMLADRVTRKDILERSKKLRLTPIERANRIFENAKKASQLIIDLLNASDIIDRQELYFKIRETIIPRETPIFSKAILVSLLDLSKDTNHYEFFENFEEIIQKITTKKSHYLLKDIVNTVADIVGVKRKDDDEKDDLKTALEITKQEIESLKEELEELKENKFIETIVHFFRELNSAQNNYLLDQFSISAMTIKKLKKEKFHFPEQLESIPVNIRMFIKFIENLGIKPIANIGDKFPINFEQSEDFEYIGTPFEDSDTKIVEVVKPGWKYDNYIISKPEVKEILD